MANTIADAPQIDPVWFNNNTDDPIVWDGCYLFSGGMVSFAKAAGLNETESALLHDCYIHISGQLRKRRGVADLKDPPGPIVSGKTIQGLKWFDTPTLDKLFAAINGSIYSYDPTTRVWTSHIAAAIGDVNEQISMAQLSDDLFWTDSTMPGIRRWDSSTNTVGTILASPLATILMSASLRLVAAGVGTAPNTLFFSDYLNGASWPVIQAIGIGEDGDPITCIKKWQKYFIIVGKLQSIYMVDANPAYGSVAAFPVLEVHASIGCVAKRSMCQLGQDMFFLSRDGVMKVTPQDATDTNVFVPLPVSQPIQDVINSIRWSHVHKSCSASYNNHYILSVPIDSNDPDTVLVYSNITQSWAGVWRGMNIMDMVEQPYLGRSRLVVGELDGVVRESRDYIQENVELENDFKDDGVDVESVVVTRAMIFRDALSPKTPFYLEAEFFSKTGTIEIYAILDGGTPVPVEDGVFTLTSAVLLPFTIPVTLVKPKWVKRKFPLFNLGQFREIQIMLVGTTGNFILRSLTLSAFRDSVNFNQQFEF